MVSHTLSLDPTFQPFTEGKSLSFETFTFSGGEPHIRINPDFDPDAGVRIAHRINSFYDLGLLCLAVDALRRLGVRHIESFIPYFPAARQDRVMSAGEPLSVKVYADIINALLLQKVTIFDPHSDVTPALLHHCQVMNNHAFIAQALSDLSPNTLLVSPDAGALKKIYYLAKALGGRQVIECSKNREIQTGQLHDFKVYADDLQGQPGLLVDDICDGGRTFLGLAAALKAKNAGPLYLAVSHGIFSNGFEALNGSFERIFTTNSIQSISQPSITQIGILL
ncbi:MAG TPA: ribose-phosphate diphosphokinase [Saprospiraceae bacterium]|nr:ribose-phosphate diphosphokinase [Saprospiraceae bacterium]